MKIGTIGFGRVDGQRPEARAFAASEQDRLHRVPDDTRTPRGAPKFGPRAEFGYSVREARRADLGLRMNLPNALTLARIFLVPLLVVVLLTKFEGRLVFGVRKELVGAAIFGIASLTDWLDGYLARRRQQVTTLGQLMDPLADKLLITAALVSLVQMDARARVDGGGHPRPGVRGHRAAQHRVCARRGDRRRRRSARSRWSSQVVAILLLILGRDHLQQFFVLGRIALWLAVITAVGSGVDYYRRFNHVLTGGRKADGNGGAGVGDPVEPIDVAGLQRRETRAGSRRP